jgi:hypothetical protein
MLKCARFLLISIIIVKATCEDELEDEISIFKIQMISTLKGCDLWYH